MVTGALSRLLNNTCSNVASDPSHRNIHQERGLEEGKGRLGEREGEDTVFSLSLMDDNILQFPSITSYRTRGDRSPVKMSVFQETSKGTQKKGILKIHRYTQHVG